MISKINFRKLMLFSLAVLLLITAVAMIWLELTKATVNKMPALKDADIILQTSSSGQSNAILLATQSLYTHMGLIKVTESGIVVIEAGSTVKETPLQEWIDRGRAGRVTIIRWKNDLSNQQTKEILNKAEEFYGQLYDPYFTMDSRRQYCSEIVWRAYSEVGIKLGALQKIGDLSLDSTPVRSLVEARWRSHPLCQNGKAKDFDECWKSIIKENIITPASIAQDRNMTTIFSNYSYK